MKLNSFAFFSFVFVLLLGVLCVELGSFWFPFWDCEGPPFLYLTFHHNIQGVRKYSRNGCFLSNNILHGKTKYINEARSVGVSQYRGHEALYVCEARAKGNQSKVMVFSSCDRNGGREYIKTVTSGVKNPGVNHPYGIAFDKFKNIYISFQHTNTVLRFYKDTFEPIPPPDYLTYLLNTSHSLQSMNITLYPGVFFQYVYPSTEGIRDITFVGDDLWVVNEDIKGISIVNSNGQEIHRIHLRDHAKPIGLYYDHNIELVFVSTRSSYGAVYGINPRTREVEKVYYIEGMFHSTGVVSYEGVLYVAEQGLGKVMAFDIHTTDFLEIVVDHFPDTIEKLALSNC